MESSPDQMRPDPLKHVAGLDEPIRRAVYRVVASEPGGAGREKVAEMTGLKRARAGYHLDKLAAAGLLKVRYERLTGRRGPGAGRPAKIYERGDDPIAVSLPTRDYETIAALLSRAIDVQPAHSRLGIVEAVVEAGRDHGRRMWRGATTLELDPDDVGCPALAGLLAGHGYEPYQQAGELRLRNCPFDAVARRHRELICAMNLAIVQGAIEESGAGCEASLDPREGECCVAITTEVHS
ncbi:MAG TPA: transcriptional regulator [Acidimicrobiia bacterium]|nr:transcriptional regulator [Acidimicrobiia bacterium]